MNCFCESGSPMKRKQLRKSIAIKYGSLVLAGDSIMFFLSLIACLELFISNMDGPRVYFPSLKSGGKVGFFFRILHNVISWYEYGPVIACSCIIVAICISVSEFLLDRLTDRTPTLVKYKIHRWLTIFECLSRDITKVVVPFVLIASVVLAVSSNYVLVRLYTVEMFIYLIFVLLSFSLAIVVYFILFPVCRFNEISECFLRKKRKKYKVYGKKGKQQILLSLRPLRFYVASLGYFSKKAKKHFFDVIFDQTMNVLLLN